MVGEEGVVKALREQGFQVITDAFDETKVVAVVAGIDRALTYEKLRRATAHVRAGALFFGTNPDKTFPMPEGLVPGAGSILVAIATAADVEPVVVGKPAPFMFQLSAERMNLTHDEILVIGDPPRNGHCGWTGIWVADGAGALGREYAATGGRMDPCTGSHCRRPQPVDWCLSMAEATFIYDLDLPALSALLKNLG